MGTRELSDELARALLMFLPQSLRERASLAEGVCEVAVANRDEHARSCHTLMQGPPFVLCEICLGRHASSFPAHESGTRILATASCVLPN